jgi:hypothetical protein
VEDDRAQLASFIGSHVKELALLARRAGLDTLCFLLEMATLEASKTSDDSDAPGVELDGDRK